MQNVPMAGSESAVRDIFSKVAGRLHDMSPTRSLAQDKPGEVQLHQARCAGGTGKEAAASAASRGRAGRYRLRFGGFQVRSVGFNLNTREGHSRTGKETCCDFCG